MNYRPYRAPHLVQWNARMRKNDPTQLVDKVVEAVMYQQGIQFEHTDEYRSVYDYHKLCEQLEHYDRSYMVRSENSDIKRGLSTAFRIFACPDANLKLRPVNLVGTSSELIKSLAIKDRSAGLTAYGENKIEAFATGLDKAGKILTENKAPAPCLAGIRTQRKGKTRLVWMYPLEMTIIEAVVARPLIDYFKAIEHVMSFGDYSHETGMRMRKSCASNRYFYSIDQSQFDACVSPLFIRYAFNAFRTWFNLDDKVYADVTVEQVFKIVENYFITTPIVMPSEGKYPVMVTGKRGGVPSGSYFTQLVDSFTNVALLMACSSRFGLNLKDSNVCVLGDDGLFFCNDARLETLLNEMGQFVSSFGFKLNASKSECGLTTADVPYLGRHWRNGFPIRQMRELTRGALYPEKFRRYSPNKAVRELQAMNVIGSFLLTSYLDDPTCDTETFRQVYCLTPNMSSGFSAYLLSEGLIPGQVLTRAIF